MPGEGARHGGAVNSTGRLAEFGTSIFAEMSALAVQHGAVNLGQGFPDTDGPSVVLEAAVAAIRGGQNQYPPGIGIPTLRQAIADHQRDWYSLEYDPASEIIVTAGATEALTAAILALTRTGDEVILLEPYYDSYAAAIALAGAVRRPVPLLAPREPGDRWHLDAAGLEAAVGPRTRLILLNSPHNPTGFVATPDELAAVARIATTYDLVVITDEVYEHLVFSDAASPHIPLATLPGMRERTVSISSAGKTFSTTGWKVGWACASPALTTAVWGVKQFLTFANAAPLQPAVAVGLGLGQDHLSSLAPALRAKRDLLAGGLTAAGFDVLRSEGTYFLTADISPLGESDGLAFCRALPERCGVVAVPSQVFYDHAAAGARYVRFAVCKRDEVLLEACERLARLG
jgi:N-succinyldiaminopimelate aminotransferase